jgi:pyrrolysine biosynthesis protein PylC
MLIAVVGGKLQGVEVIYLAQKLGYQTLLIDKNPDAIASRLCEQFIKFEFSLEQPNPPDCPPIDIILPAIEDDEALAAIKEWAVNANIPVAIDLESYAVSRSKTLSDDFFRNLTLSTPGRWPECGFPVVVKPDQESGSRGVAIIHDLESLNSHISINNRANPLVIQEYIKGPSYSIEVIGRPGNFLPLQVTEIHMDKDYDCKRVTAPCGLSFEQICVFENIGLQVAEKLKLCGIMDLEVILHGNELKLLEIDARFPSQTPMAVYWSTGFNMVGMLCDLFIEQKSNTSVNKVRKHVSVEHIRVKAGMVQVLGEHIMSSDTPLTLEPGFFGAEEALTSYLPGKSDWVATMIFTGKCAEEVTVQRKNCYEKITQNCNFPQEENL